MIKRKINVLDYLFEILKVLLKGIFLIVKGEEKVNIMVISWGVLGIEWNKLFFIVYIRENRYIKVILDKILDFIINILFDKMDLKVFNIFGIKSGRDIDKIKEVNLIFVDFEIVFFFVIKELFIILECKVLYK